MNQIARSLSQLSARRWASIGLAVDDKDPAWPASEAMSGKGRKVAGVMAVGATTLASLIVSIASATAACPVGQSCEPVAPPRPAFTFSPPSPRVGETVTFTSASEAEAGIMSEEWDLDGDGTFDDASGSTATGAFATPGAHRVALRVTDFEGRVATAAETVKVSAATVSVGFVSGVTTGKSLIYTAQDGARNEVTISHLDSTYRVSDAGTALVAGDGCSNLDAHTVSCAGGSVVRSDVWLADLDDHADLSPSSGPVPVHAVVGGGKGNDRLRAGSYRDLLAGDEGEDVLEGMGGDDWFIGGRGDDLMRGGDGDDVFQLWLASTGPQPPDGADVLDGGSGIDHARYDGRFAPVRVTIGDGPNDGDISTDEGDDVQSTVENVTGGSGDDLLIGSEMPNVIVGGHGSDRIYGRGGGDTLEGGFGDDRLDGGAGADLTRGGGGTADTALYSARDRAVNATIDGAANDGEAAEGDTIETDVENLTGGSGDDTLTGSSGEYGNVIRGGRGKDRIDGNGIASPSDARDELFGERGNDRIKGGSAWGSSDGGEAFVRGGPGADTITTRGGTEAGVVSSDDTVRCDSEMDAVTADLEDRIAADCELVDRTAPPHNEAPPQISGTARAGEIVTASAGSWAGTEPLRYSYQWRRCDPTGANCSNLSGETGQRYTHGAADVGHTLRVNVQAANAAGSGTATSDPTQEIRAPAPCYGEEATIVGTAGNDTLVGTAGPDVIVGLEGHDQIEALGGADLICGTGGDDRVSAGADADRVRGGPGVDVLLGDAGADDLAGDADNDTLRGGTENDRLTGAAGSDRLFGEAGDDRLFGQDGDDSLTGGHGVDLCDGGPGTNVFTACE